MNELTTIQQLEALSKLLRVFITSKNPDFTKKVNISFILEWDYMLRLQFGSEATGFIMTFNLRHNDYESIKSSINENLADIEVTLTAF